MIMKKLITVAVFALLANVLVPSASVAFHEKFISIGFSYYTQDSLKRISKNETGTIGFLGEANYPFNLKYDYKFGADWFG
jgi:hypothetical protein